VKEFLTQPQKMAKCMIYIGTYAWGECEGISFTPFTPSPRRPSPLGGSVINGTIQQLLPPAGQPPEPLPPLASPPHHTAPQPWFHCPTSARCGEATTAACMGPGRVCVRALPAARAVSKSS